jgi:precorrin-6B C5,15-methyltransferase / cobalt-precorrin-6B C5,C15-methyltransferase
MLTDLFSPGRSPDNWQPPLVVLAGVGMSKNDLSLRTLAWIERAEILVGSRRVLSYFADHPGDKRAFQSSMNATLLELEAFSATHRSLVLASGDPLFYGVGKRLVHRLGRERLLVLPGISSVQALFARLVEPWEDVRVLSLHGRSGANWLGELRRYAKLAVYTDPQHTPAWIAEQLLDGGVTDRCLVVGEDLGSLDEKVQVLSLEEATGRSFSPLNLVAILPLTPQAGGSEASTPAARWPLLGLADEAFEHQAGLITKVEVRAVVLAQLQLMADLVLWDVGAGSGSVAIEAARLAPLRQVLAVEKNPARYQDLVANVKRFHCGEIRTVPGAAPEALQGLADPDRVFIGGSGGDLPAILRVVAERLRPGGRVVHSAVTLDSLEQIRAFWSGQPVELSILELQVSRSVPIGESQRLEALNPVFIITAANGG